MGEWWLMSRGRLGEGWGRGCTEAGVASSELLMVRVRNLGVRFCVLDPLHPWRDSEHGRISEAVAYVLLIASMAALAACLISGHSGFET